MFSLLSGSINDFFAASTALATLGLQAHESVDFFLSPGQFVMGQQRSAAEMNGVRVVTVCEEEWSAGNVRCEQLSGP